MNAYCRSDELVVSFPRYFRFGRYCINSYTCFLGIGIYVGTLMSAAVAQFSGISPLRMGIGATSCGIVGLFGARLFYVAFNSHRFSKKHFWAEVWSPQRGGLAVFGGLVIVPYSVLLAPWLGIPFAICWDHMIWGIVTGGMIIRFGCICNGCCNGKPTSRWYGVWQHDTQGIRLRRIPAQWLEIGWWLLAAVGLLCLWPHELSAGSYALGGLAWYGLGRFWLETVREHRNKESKVRINQVVAAVLALTTGAALLWNS